eukprot:6480454-Amphidinium_carterae.1
MQRALFGYFNFVLASAIFHSVVTPSSDDFMESQTRAEITVWRNSDYVGSGNLAQANYKMAQN